LQAIEITPACYPNSFTSTFNHEHTVEKVRKNKEEIRGIIQANLSSSQIFLLRSHLNMIDAVTKQIEEIDAKISDQISLSLAV